MKKFFAIMLASTAAFAGQCGCDDCNCVPENHCGCMDNDHSTEHEENQEHSSNE